FLDCMMMQPRDNKRPKPPPDPTLNEALDSDLLLRCASYLDVDGLAWLGRASAVFGIPQAGQQRSLANEAAHQLFRRSATDEERRCLPKHGDESDIGLYRALEQLREPLSFDELAGTGSAYKNIQHVSETNALVIGRLRPVSLTNGIDLEADWGGNVNPMSVMSRHKPAASGKLRSQRTVNWKDSNIHCCCYSCYHGRCGGTEWDTKVTDDDWHGREGLDGSGTIGLLLDLDEGTLSVFKNDRRLGVMKEGGLSGEYCWFVSAYSSCEISMLKSRAPN
ncbi:hypothetical protein THAOC_15269, partial [Thalassiosira oceanica]